MPKGITHEQFVKKVAARSGFAVQNVDVALNAALDVIAAEIQSAGSINLKGIGRLFRTRRPAHPGRNPRTGAAVQVPAKTRVRFKASSCLVP
jgi:DNA-binding protein HU-beta